MRLMVTSSCSSAFRRGKWLARDQMVCRRSSSCRRRVGYLGDAGGMHRLSLGISPSGICLASESSEGATGRVVFFGPRLQLHRAEQEQGGDSVTPHFVSENPRRRSRVARSSSMGSKTRLRAPLST
ncbi:hypothetical protein GUJ93_ZPchr0012g19037 [Zizania palustris]|uniref:Uncharacterized protein n=1 Tax=Zizania palustris TaxID=103762 RepID=A0A8J5WP65_ZIZPA|nr:hypothetical protein GUJ93_ZPchr0012g19037 [Zizania palustris]